MIQLCQFYQVDRVRTQRKAKCRNCGNDPWGEPKHFAKGETRLVIKSSYNRNLSLCFKCAEWQASRLEAMAHEIRAAMRPKLEAVEATA